MASKSLGTLTVDLIAKIGGFVSGMSKAERQVEKSSSKIESRVNKMNQKVESSFKGLGAAVAGFISFQAIKAGFEQVVSAGLEYGDKIDEIANRLQISAEKFQEITFAAKFTGVSEEDIQGGLARLAKGISEAQEEGSKMANLFDAMGISTKNADGTLRDVSSVLTDIQGVFAQTTDATGEMALAMELFGKSGVKFLEFLNLGPKGMEEFAQKARDLGLILSNDTVANVAAFQDNLDKMKIVLSVVGAEIASELLPVVIDLGKWISSLTKEYHENAGTAGTLADAIDLVSVAFKMLAGFVKAAGFAYDTYKLVSGQVINFVITNVDSLVDNIKTAINFISKLASLDVVGALAEKNRGVSRYVENLKKGVAGAQSLWRDFEGNTVDSSKRTAQQVNRNLSTIGNFTPVPSWGSNPWATPIPVQQPVTASGILADANAAGNKNNQPKIGGGGGGGVRISGGRSSGGGGGGKSEADKAIEDAKNAQERLNEMFNDAILGYEQTLFMLGKEGEYSKMLWETEKGRYAELSQAQKDELLNKAKIVDEMERQNEAAERFKELTKDSDQYLSDLEFQALLIGKSREEQELMNLARQLELELQEQSLGMTQQQIEALRAKNAEIVSTVSNNQQLEESMRQQVGVMDEIRGSFSNALSDWLSGTASFKDAFLGALESINQRILKMISDNLMEQLFGGFGTSGAGSKGGGFLSGITSWLFGGGKANGGHVSAGSFQRVNERGPELLTTSGGKQYLMMGDNSGTVTPNHMGGKRGGFTQSNTFVVQGRIDKRTQLQIAQEAGRRANNAQNRG